MKPKVPKKTQKASQYQTKLSNYYHPNQQKPMKKDQQDGWTISQRVELRHTQHPSESKEGPSSHPAPYHSNHSANDQISSISANSHTPQRVENRKEPSKKVNIEFYLNQMASQPYGEYIDKIHETWYHNYEKLERDHSFIQWIFPNSYQSRFNSYAKPLSKEEAEQFRCNPQIIRRYLKSYDMMLAFYGIKIKDKHTGELVRSRQPNYKERFYKTLITSWHNHMRVTRILCSLKETGFGRYAAQLASFLKFQIYDKNGELGALKKYSVYKEWEPFEHFQEKAQPINYYLEKINKKIEEHPQPHLKRQTLIHKADCLREEHRSNSLENSPGHRGSQQVCKKETEDKKK